MPSTADPLHIAVIVGSTRPHRIGRVVADWFVAQLDERDDLRSELVDLADADLPAVFEGTPAVDRFRERLDVADAFVVVTPEYNHSFPASLKQAVDLAHREWFAKPVGFVSYGGMAGGARAVEQLRQVFAELHATTIRDVVAFHGVHGQFVEGRLVEPEDANLAAKTMVDQLAWWARALRDARRREPYAA